MIQNESIDNNAIAQKAIIKILQERGISHIVYVDDNINKSLTKEQFLVKLRLLYPKRPAYVDFVNWKLPIVTFEKSIKDLWEKSTPEEKLSFSNILTQLAAKNIKLG